MYRFVRIRRKNSSDYGTWYFVPKCVEDLDTHWNASVAPEFKKAVRDRLNGTHFYKLGKKEQEQVYVEHPRTNIGWTATQMLEIKGGSFAEQLIGLEQLAYQQRLECLKNGKKMYLPEGVAIYLPCEDNIDIAEEVETEFFKYPTKRFYTMDDVRYMQWNLINNKGAHWYAKIENKDVVDKDGNMKWNTREEAEHAAAWFIEMHNPEGFKYYGNTPCSRIEEAEVEIKKHIEQNPNIKCVEDISTDFQQKKHAN